MFSVSWQIICFLQVVKGMKFIGGESAALSRIYEYFWKKVKLMNLAIYISFDPDPGLWF